MLSTPAPIADGLLDDVAQLLSFADGDHDLQLRDALFNVTDVLETTAVTGAHDVKSHDLGSRAAGTTTLAKYTDTDGGARKVAKQPA